MEKAVDMDVLTIDFREGETMFFNTSQCENVTIFLHKNHNHNLKIKAKVIDAIDAGSISLRVNYEGQLLFQGLHRVPVRPACSPVGIPVSAQLLLGERDEHSSLDVQDANILSFIGG